MAVEKRGAKRQGEGKPFLGKKRIEILVNKTIVVRWRNAQTEREHAKFHPFAEIEIC